MRIKLHRKAAARTVFQEPDMLHLMSCRCRCSWPSRCCFARSSVSSASKHTGATPMTGNTGTESDGSEVIVRIASQGPKIISRFPLRSSTSPSAVRSHLSHKNTCVSEPSGLGSWPLTCWRSSTLLQCQSKLGNPVCTSSWSRTRTTRPSGPLGLTRTRHV